MRYLIVLCAALSPPVFPTTAHALLGGFETADGYAFPFATDNWAYDAGQTGGSFLPSQYNTGRWQELFGSSLVGDSQYVSQHGIGSGGALGAPFALAVRSISPSSDGSYDMTVQYSMGADDLGVAPTTPLNSAVIDFDICPGLTIIPGVGVDPIFNNLPAFSLHVGGTSSSPGVTVGFSDQDPSNANQTRLFHRNGGAYNTTVVPWSGSRFDHIQIVMDFGTQTYDLYWTKDANLTTNAFDAGNVPVLITSSAAFSNSISVLDELYFETHTDPSDGTAIAGLEKSFLDNFSWSVTPIPEPASATMLALAVVGIGCARWRGERGAE
jgi:hypothetical protein